MNKKYILKLSEQIYTKKEYNFLDAIEGNYSYKSNFRFLIVYAKITKEELYTIFEGLLKEVLIYKCDKYYIIIYHNKERINIINYVDALSEDFGYNINIFEGCLVDKKEINLFLEFIKIYNKNVNSFTYSTIGKFILNSSFEKQELCLLKELILSKYFKDIQFVQFVFTLFDNNLNVSKSAKDAYLHRNTVNNKLANFENDTTLVLQNFKDAIVVYTLLK